MSKRVLLAGVAMPLVALAAPAWAQQPYAGIEEILVTTQKREQSVRDVPISISAYSGDFLEQIGVTEFDELSLFTPGLTIQEQSPNNPGFVIRGITSDSGSSQIAPRVTIYLNGVDVSRSRGSYFDLFDIERIETVKGPQATLFGTAAAIGAVSVVTAKPEPGLSAEARASFGNFDAYRVSGFINAGTDMIAGRLAASFKQRDGFIRNVAAPAAGGNDNADLNGQDVFGLRGSLRFTPSDQFQADLVLTYDRQTPPGTSFKSGTFAPAGGDTDPTSFAALGGSPFSEQVLGLDRLGLKREVYDANLTLRYQFDDRFSITSITGYRDFDSLEVFDADGTAAWYLEFAEDATGDQFSQELRLDFDSGDRFKGFVGASFFTEDGEQGVPFSTEEGIFLQCAAGLIPGLPCIAPDGSVAAAQATALLTNGLASVLPYQASFTNTGTQDIISVFIDGSYQITDWLELTAGVRYLYEDKTSGFFSTLPPSVLTGAPLLPFANTGGVEVTASEDYDAILPRFNALARLNDDVNVYATIAKGRRSDVLDVNAVAGAAQPTALVNMVPAEIIWNFEGGVKARLLDGRVNVGANIFYQTYKNFQVSRLVNGDVVTENAGDAANQGVELEFSAEPAEGFSLFGNIAYIDAGIDDKPANGIFAGNRFRLQSEWAASAGGTIRQPVGEDYSLFLTATWTYESDKFFELPNDPAIAEEDVHLVNLRGGFGNRDGRWELHGFVTNLFDKKYIIDAGNTGGSFGIPTFIAGAPRFYGIEVIGRF
ncbi:MAG: TonB-dependent receptor [Sphingomonadales bacterium]